MAKVKQMTLAELDDKFSTDDACKGYLMSNRWPSGAHCPRCGNPEVKTHGTMEWHWVCYACPASESNSYRFSITVGTIFENTNMPLTTWFKIIYLMLQSKKGISALQIQRMFGIGSYRTALYMCNRVRVALGTVEFRKLTGFVEIDETYVGGKAKNMHMKGKYGGPRGKRGSEILRGPKGKAIVIGAVQRKGKVVARVIENTSLAIVERFVRHAVADDVSLISTDEHRSYGRLWIDYPHGVIPHSQHQYVHGAVHTNTIEGFWSMVKRGIIGTFHKVSKAHLPLYVNEFEFRYNNRENPDIFGAAIRAC